MESDESSINITLVFSKGYFELYMFSILFSIIVSSLCDGIKTDISGNVSKLL